MEVLGEDLFVKLQEKMDFIPHTQSYGWLKYTIAKRNKSVIFFSNSIENTLICCWGEIYKIPFIGKILRIDGESISYQIQEGDYKIFYEQISEYVKKEHFAFVKVSNNNFYEFSYEIALRQAGFIRPMALSVCPLTIILDPDRERRPKKSWHYQYAQAKKQNYKFEVGKGTDEELAVFVRMYAEMARIKNLNSVPDTNSLKELIRDPHYNLFFLYSSEGEPLAAHLDYAYKERGFHMMSANSLKAREKKGVTQFLMEKVFEWMKEQGVKCYDLGRVGPSTHNSNSVYEYKRYTGGELKQYNGEFVCVYRKWAEILYGIYLTYKIPRF